MKPNNRMSAAVPRMPYDLLKRLWGSEVVDGTIAEACNVKRTTLFHWQKNGLSVYSADIVAISLGLHPSSIWGDLWWEAGLIPNGKAA